MAAQYDLKFHRKIIDIAGLTLLQRVLDNLHLIENSFTNSIANEPSGEWHPAKWNPYTHHAIVDALANRDKKCVNLLKKHIQWVKKVELKKFDKKNNQQVTTIRQSINQGGELLAAVNY
jgi:DNA-binding GntR family transcriptional regulator